MSSVTQATDITCTGCNANTAADHDFVRDTQLRAADLEPFLRRARKIKLRAIAR